MLIAVWYFDLVFGILFWAVWCLDIDPNTKMSTAFWCMRSCGSNTMHVGPTSIGWLQAHVCLDLYPDSVRDMSSQSIFLLLSEYAYKVTMIAKYLSLLSSPLDSFLLMVWLENFSCSLCHINHLFILVRGCCWVYVPAVSYICAPLFSSMWCIIVSVFYFISLLVVYVFWFVYPCRRCLSSLLRLLLF